MTPYIKDWIIHYDLPAKERKGAIEIETTVEEISRMSYDEVVELIEEKTKMSVKNILEITEEDKVNHYVNNLLAYIWNIKKLKSKIKWKEYSKEDEKYINLWIEFVKAINNPEVRTFCITKHDSPNPKDWKFDILFEYFKTK